MTRGRLELLQWYALFGGALAWATEHVVGYFVSDAGCNVAGGQWGLHVRALQIVLAAATAAVVLSAESAALLALRALRDVDGDAAGPHGRIRFFAQAAALGNVLFLVVVVLDGIGTVYHLPCTGR